MFTRRKIILSVLVFAGFAILLPFFNCNQGAKTPSYHSFLNSKEFKTLTRKDQVLKCAGCHKLEYENEMKGPHANAFRLLTEHKAFINSPAYNCDFYTKRVNSCFDDCTRCHAPENLLQTILKDSAHNSEFFIKNLLVEKHPIPEKRSFEGRLSSIDCMSCHYDGSDMISLQHIATKEDSIASLQTLEKRTKNNLACYVCHADVVRTIDPVFAIRKTGTVRCVSCHQQFDDKGNGTHYYYWKHDPSDKVNPHFSEILNDFKFSWNADHNAGNLIWNNTTIPHSMSPGPELILLCSIMDKDSAILGSKTIRLNKKKEFDAEQYHILGNHNYYGIEGDEVPLHREAVKYPVEMKNPKMASFMKISIIHKAQYWFPDSLGVVTITRCIPLTN
jgi:hypothetical protein